MVLAASEPVLGTELRGGTVSVPAGTTVSDDVYAFGDRVDVAGAVSGDLLAWAGDIVIGGRITEDALLAGGSVRIAGTVGDDLRAAGGELVIGGNIADNASVAGGDITFSQSSRIGRDLQVAGGTIRLDGTVARNALIAGGEVTVNGTVGGDVQADVGTLRVGPNAVIRGKLTYTSDRRADIDPGARIAGGVEFREKEEPERRGLPFVFMFIWWLLTLLALFLVGILLIALAPKMSADVADRILRSPGLSVLVGFVTSIVMPVIGVAVMLTVIGIPLGFLILALYVILLYLSRVYIALAVGRWLVAKAGRPDASLYADLALGLLILWILFAIPFVGWALHLIAVWFGLGGLAVERYRLTKELRQEGRI
jgi:cytoskeletal protein CcmA (bactofilin family)